MAMTDTDALVELFPALVRLYDAVDAAISVEHDQWRITLAMKDARDAIAALLVREGYASRPEHG